MRVRVGVRVRVRMRVRGRGRGRVGVRGRVRANSPLATREPSCAARPPTALVAPGRAHAAG